RLDRAAHGRVVGRGRLRQPAYRSGALAPGGRVSPRAGLFDVDFTIARPGPELGPEGYQRLGSRFGLELEPTRYAEAREKAIEGLRRPPPPGQHRESWARFPAR